MAESTKTMSTGFKVTIIIVAIGILFLLKGDNRNKITRIIQDITIRDKSLDFIKRIELEDGVTSVNLYDDILVKCNKNKLSLIKSDDSVVWEKEFDFIEPYVYYGEEVIYAIDKSTGHIYSMDANGDTVYKVQLNERVFGVNESNGDLLVHIKSDEGEKIKILNRTGDIIVTYEDLYNNILYYNLNNDGDNYSISTIDTRRDTLISQLGIYNFSGEKLKEIEFKNMIILRTEFLNEDILVLTDTSINYIGDGIVKWKRHFPGIKDMRLQGDKILIIYDKNFETIGLDGKTIDKFVFAADYSKIKDSEKITFLYGKYDILGVKGDRELLSYKFDSEILDLYVYQSLVYIHTLEEIEIFKLKTK